MAVEIYGTIPCVVDPQKFRERIAEIQVNGALRYEVMSSAQFSKTKDNVLWDMNKY